MSFTALILQSNAVKRRFIEYSVRVFWD